MTERELTEILQSLIEDVDSDLELEETLSFSDAGLLTNNQGLVIKMIDGSEFQLTIVKS